MKVTLKHVNMINLFWVSPAFNGSRAWPALEGEPICISKHQNSKTSKIAFWPFKEGFWKFGNQLDKQNYLGRMFGTEPHPLQSSSLPRRVRARVHARTHAHTQDARLRETSVSVQGSGGTQAGGEDHSPCPGSLGKELLLFKPAASNHPKKVFSQIGFSK